jgi:A/G-specific adenine glycosylase
MLQQTQVATVIPYYQRFIASFPSISTLAAATEEQVLAHWSGLGYYARGRNLHKSAQIIVEKHHGEFPRGFEQILELPGIGRSTAAAICALAYHERRAILDGNVKRLLARYCGVEGWAGNKKVEEQLWQNAEALLPPRDVATYTQALMDMGATVCTRSKPKCVLCPLQDACVALQTERTAELPSPRPRKTVPERQATFLLLTHGNDILLEKRPSSGIWGGLWCPPQFEDEAAALTWCAQQGIDAALQPVGAAETLSSILSQRERKQSPFPPPGESWIEGSAANIHRQQAGSYDGQCEAFPVFTHTFTHFKLHISPLKIQLVRKPLHAEQPGGVWLDVEAALHAAIPTPVRELLKKLRKWKGK